MGKVRPTDGPSADEIEVVVLPLPRRESARPHGSFRLENLKIVNGVWPELEVSAIGYFPENLILNKDQLELHPERKLAVLKEPVELWGDQTDPTILAATLDGGQEDAQEPSGS